MNIRKAIICLPLLIYSAMAFAQNNGVTSFNYNKWKAEQEAKEAKLKPQKTTSADILPQTAIYVDGYVQAGPLHGLGASIGGYLKNFNLEATYMHGLQESYQIERIYGDAHHYFTYRPSYWGVKAGYGFPLLNCLRLTPQGGYGLMQISGTQAREINTRGKDNSNVSSISFGVRLHYQFIRHFGITIIPEYRIKVAESESFLDQTDSGRGKVSPLSNTSDLTNWAEGFTCKFALTVDF